MNNYTITDVHISTIKAGDTILHTDNKITTVSNSNIKNGFMGITLFGDAYRLGRLPVKKVTFNKPSVEKELYTSMLKS